MRIFLEIKTIHNIFNISEFSISNSPWIVAARGTGRINKAPTRSTIQRFLMRTKLTILLLISQLLMFMMTPQLNKTVIRMMLIIREHWNAWEMMKTLPEVSSRKKTFFKCFQMYFSFGWFKVKGYNLSLLVAMYIWNIA